MAIGHEPSEAGSRPCCRSDGARQRGSVEAATDRAMYVRLKVAYDDGHRVITSAAVLAEIIRGSSRDAEMHRVLARVGVEPVSEAIGQRAGQLIGAAGMSAGQAVDAIVAATAIAAAEYSTLRII